MHVDGWDTNKKLEELFLKKLPNAAILIFDRYNGNKVLKIAKSHRYPGEQTYTYVNIAHRDNYNYSDAYVSSLEPEAQTLNDDGSFTVVLCGNIGDPKQIHPIHGLLSQASKNKKIGIDFASNFHFPDYPSSLDYPQFEQGKYRCLRWNCPYDMEQEFIYTLEFFDKLRAQGRTSNNFIVGLPADDPRQWALDEATTLKELTELVEIQSLTLMSASLMSDMDRVKHIKDSKLLEIELQRLRELKEQI